MFPATGPSRTPAGALVAVTYLVAITAAAPRVMKSSVLPIHRMQELTVSRVQVSVRSLGRRAVSTPARLAVTPHPASPVLPLCATLATAGSTRRLFAVESGLLPLRKIRRNCFPVAINVQKIMSAGTDAATLATVVHAQMLNCVAVK